MARRLVPADVVRPDPREARGGSRRGKQQGSRSGAEAKVKARAQQLHESGMPMAMAVAVAKGKLDLNEALERMSRQARVEAMMRRHDLSRALATQIVLGQASLERVLHKRRFAEHRVSFRDHSLLQLAAQEGASLRLWVHSQGTQEGRVTAVEPYEVHLEGHEAPVHKLQIKLAVRSPHAEAVAGAVTLDPELHAEPRPVISRPQDRFACSDKRLFRHLDRQHVVAVTTLEGERLHGRVTWISRFELGLEPEGLPGVEVAVFRHALADLREVS